MSFKTEFFDAHWWDEGIHFATKDEAVAHGQARSRVFRVTEVDDPANYRWRDGKLVPGTDPPLTPSAWEKLWNEIHKQGIHGGIVWEDIWGQRSAVMAENLLKSFLHTHEVAVQKSYERAFYHGDVIDFTK